MPTIRNIIIFVTIAAVFVLIYIFFIKPPSNQATLTSSAPNTSLPDVNNANVDQVTSAKNSELTQDFLVLLLNVKNIKLDDSIFSDPAWRTLHDSTITLIPDGTEGRPNPFARFGNDAVIVPPASSTPPDTSLTPPNMPI